MAEIGFDEFVEAGINGHRLPYEEPGIIQL